MSLHGPITICDPVGKILRVLTVAEAIAARDKQEAQRKQREAIAATVARARMRRRERTT